MTEYTAAFRSKIVQRLMIPGGPTATILAKEVGVCQSTLSRWRRDALAAVSSGAEDNTMSEKPIRGPSRRPQDWGSQQKFRAVLEANSLSEVELGEFLRRRGLHEAQLEQWRGDALAGLERAPEKRKDGEQQQRRIRELERELRRKDSALAETAALLVLQKKVQSLWVDEESATARKSAR
jgi:transposase-like protein